LSSGAANPASLHADSSDPNHIQRSPNPDLLNANRGPPEKDPPVEALPYLSAAFGFSSTVSSLSGL
jgi:hypothetical protein